MNINNPKELKLHINKNLEDGLITVKYSKRYPTLRVVKYTRKVFYDNLWDDFLVECRGLVIDEDYNVVVQPMKKIFNYGENGYYPKIEKDTLISVYKKFNGFLGCVTNTPKYGLIFSTTGSLDSVYCDYIKEIFESKRDSFFYNNISSRVNTGITWYFEICHPNDPHIIKESEKLYFLASRCSRQHIQAVEHKEIKTLNDLFSSDEKIEGWVCKTDKGEYFKIKTPYYLRTKFFARANMKKLEHVIKNGDFNLGNFLQNFDEDFCEIFDIVKVHQDEFLLADEQTRISIIENGLRNEKI